jgi:hypothetical protein
MVFDDSALIIKLTKIEHNQQHIMTPSDAKSTISKYLGKTLRVHTTDNRAFVGQMKCTDNVSHCCSVCMEGFMGSVSGIDEYTI